MANAFYDNYSQGLDIARKTRAYNALRATYGDAAGDPEAAGKLAQSAQMQAQTAEIAPNAASTRNLQGAQAGELNATAVGKRQSDFRAAGFTAAAAIKGVADAGGDVGAAFDTFVGKDPTSVGLTPEQAQQLRAAIVADPKHLDNIINGLRGPVAGNYTAITTQDENGNQTTQLVDKKGINAPVTLAAPQANAVQGQERITNTVRHQGVTEGQGQQRIGIAQQNANTGVTRAGIAQQNANTNARRQNVTENNTDFGASADAPAAGGAPVMGAPTARTIPTQGGAPVQGGASAPAKQPLFDRLPPKGKQAAIGEAQNIQIQKVNLDNANAIADSMVKQIGPWSTGAGSLMSRLPGGLAKNLERNAETMQSAAASAVMQGMKNAKGTAGGVRLQQEYKNFTTQLGNMHTDQSGEQFAYHLKLAKDSINKIFAAQADGFKAKWERPYDEVLGGGQAPAAGAKPDPLGLR